MIKNHCVLAILAFLMFVSVSGASDYLGDGYVSSGYNGDMGQYFTDPIFTSAGGYYVSPDPALNMMLDSMDRQTATLGSGVARPAATQTIGRATGRTTSATGDFAGQWHLILSEGKSIDLYLYQSDARVFGSGSITSGVTFQEAFASGSVVGNSMILDIVAEKGAALYAASLDVSRLNLASYTLFKAGSQSKSGTLRASRAA